MVFKSKEHYFPVLLSFDFDYSNKLSQALLSYVTVYCAV